MLIQNAFSLKTVITLSSLVIIIIVIIDPKQILNFIRLYINPIDKLVTAILIFYL